MTGFAQVCFNEVYTPLRIAEGETFDDYLDFKKYMLQEVAYSGDGSDPQPLDPDEEETVRRELWIYHDDGEKEMVCRYVQRNMSVKTVRTSDTADGLPVTAITYTAYRIAERRIALVNGGFLALHLAEALAMLLIYRKKRVK